MAGIGLFLEFGNNVSTTRIRDVRVIRLSDTQGQEQNRFVN